MNYTPAVGDVLTRPKVPGLVDHVGVYVGSNLVLENTPGRGEHLATLHEFAAGQPVKVYPTGADPAGVIDRAHGVLAGPKRYDLVQRNCEHTATEIIEGLARSPQLAAGMAVFGLLLVVGLVSRR